MRLIVGSKAGKGTTVWHVGQLYYPIMSNNELFETVCGKTFTKFIYDDMRPEGADLCRRCESILTKIMWC